MKPEIVMLTRMLPRVSERLEPDFTIHRYYEAEDREALLKRVSGSVRGVVTHSWCPAAVMDALPGLEMIASFAVGYDGIDIEHAKARGITVTNTPDVLTDEVANFGTALVLAVTRQMPYAERYVREGRWKQGTMPFNRTIIGRRLGIVGMGRIGQAVAARLMVLGAEIVWHGPRAKSDIPFAYYPDLAEMAKECFGIVLTCPGGEATRGLVSAEVMDAIGPEGFLVNIARGSVIDEAAMVEKLVSGALGSAGLDVFQHEPNVPDALVSLDNVVLQPHQASATVETRTAMADLTADNLNRFYAGEPVLTPVT